MGLKPLMFFVPKVGSRVHRPKTVEKNPSEAVREWIFGLTLESPEIASCYSEPLANHLKTNSPNCGQDCFQKNSQF